LSGLGSLRTHNKTMPISRHPRGFGSKSSILLRAVILQAVGFFRLESCPTQAALPLVGLAADKVIRDRYNK
ncbi:MAG: hypothetical protein R6U98_12700, partial [Pirellulaceae bacterium]